MKLRGGIALAAALLLSACVFGSERPLLEDSDAAHPFTDGQIIGWREHGGDAFNIRFDRRGAGYRLERLGSADVPVDVLFVAIPQTPEDDYVAQVNLSRDGAEGVAYAFLWREGDGYRVFADPRAVNDSGEAPAEAARYCRDTGNRECGFDSVADVFGYYQNVLYGRFVTGAAAPDSYLDLGPPLDDEATKK